jgi:hypothetical protein
MSHMGGDNAAAHKTHLSVSASFSRTVWPLNAGRSLGCPLLREQWRAAKNFALGFEWPPQPTVYGVPMSRLVCLSIVFVLSLLSVAAPAAPVHKRPAPAWHGYGFLPGYHQPLSNSLPLYAQKDAMRRLARRDQRPWYIDPVPRYYGYDGEWHYFGRPGFYGGRYNGGSFGPCWTRTPIGPVWNCG